MMKFISLCSLLLLVSCAASQAPLRVNQAPDHPTVAGRPRVVHCFDGIDHIRGSLPVVLGGTCAHSPTPELIETFHKDKLLLDYDWPRLKALYESKEIKTIYDHKECNNYCLFGPHVVKGGHCMVPPTPGTKNYEEVLSGSKDLVIKRK